MQVCNHMGEQQHQPSKKKKKKKEEEEMEVAEVNPCKEGWRGCWAGALWGSRWVPQSRDTGCRSGSAGDPGALQPGRPVCTCCCDWRRENWWGKRFIYKIFEIKIIEILKFQFKEVIGSTIKMLQIGRRLQAEVCSHKVILWGHLL